MSYFKNTKRETKDVTREASLLIRMQLIEEKSSFSNYMDFYDRCIELIKQYYGISELTEEYISIIDDMAESIMGYPRFK